ncbi:Protein CBG22295 [Caenorhabditis briggsae]|uniref:Protein CBG22295 n=1 Tax=Caenorhabditis briggsae TaxID=6238 RepID=A8Y203_CAEBR|nr:Protein CBG22295 [Caenorhabditis briggsae]CAP38923.1 Protein CBG22295 [Caenorhabditis briggsae]
MHGVATGNIQQTRFVALKGLAPSQAIIHSKEGLSLCVAKFLCVSSLATHRPRRAAQRAQENWRKFECMYSVAPPVPQNQILSEIGAKYIDGTKQPPTHTVPKVYDWQLQHTEPNTDPITSHTYVVRQSDNRVASILIHEDTSRFGKWQTKIYFGVWDNTEGEYDWHPQHTEPNTDPITSHTYVVRATDNHVASIVIEEKTSRLGYWYTTIYFGVWGKIEEDSKSYPGVKLFTIYPKTPKIDENGGAIIMTRCADRLLVTVVLIHLTGT